MRAIDCKLERRIIGTLDRETISVYFAGQESRKTYTMSFVIVMRAKHCRTSKVPDFQPLVLGADTNLPSVYINLQDFRLWIQIPTSGKHETFVCQQSLDSLPPGQVVVTIVVNGNSIQAGEETPGAHLRLLLILWEREWS